MVDILKHHALGVLDNDKRGGCCWLYENRCNFYIDIVDDALKEKADDNVDADVDVVDKDSGEEEPDNWVQQCCCLRLNLRPQFRPFLALCLADTDPHCTVQHRYGYIIGLCLTACLDYTLMDYSHLDYRHLDYLWLMDYPHLYYLNYKDIWTIAVWTNNFLTLYSSILSVLGLRTFYENYWFRGENSVTFVEILTRIAGFEERIQQNLANWTVSIRTPWIVRERRWK